MYIYLYTAKKSTFPFLFFYTFQYFIMSINDGRESSNLQFKNIKITSHCSVFMCADSLMMNSKIKIS